MDLLPPIVVGLLLVVILALIVGGILRARCGDDEGPVEILGRVVARTDGGFAVDDSVFRYVFAAPPADGSAVPEVGARVRLVIRQDASGPVCLGLERLGPPVAGAPAPPVAPAA
ncbi:MAG: hypothetical protein RID91_00610 [Azospirillaceae bacterium]